MTTVSPDDTNRFRYAVHRDKWVVNAVPVVSVATAQINQSAFTYPLGQLTIDNAVGMSNVVAGQLAWIGSQPGEFDITAGVLRKPVSGSTLFIDGKSQGDPGYARNIRAALADGQFITVLKFRPGWGLMSTIRAGIFYKNYDFPYAGQGANPDPIPRLGGWRQAFAGADGFGIVEFDPDESFAWGTRTIVSYLWNLDGGIVVSGSATSRQVTAKWPPGFYEVTLTVTDSAGKSRTGYRYVWINSTDPASQYAPLNWRYPIQVTQDGQSLAGREIQIELTGQFGSDFQPFPGQGFLFSRIGATFDGADLDDSGLLVKSFVGYATEKNITTNYNTMQTAISLQAPLVLAKNVPTVTNEINEVVSPKNWTEVTKILSNPVGAVWYIAAHHAPYLIDGHDFLFDETLLTYRRRNFQFQADNAAGQIDNVGPMFLGAIGQHSDGRLRMIRNPNYFNNADRLAMDTFWTFIPADLRGKLDRAFAHKPGVGQVYGGGFSYAGGETTVAYGSLAPGYVKAQSPGVETMTNFIVPAVGGQDIANDGTGHHFALLNPEKKPFSAVLRGNLDIFEPVDLSGWGLLNIPARFDSEGVGWINERVLVSKVSREWPNDGSGKPPVITLELESETFGLPGVKVDITRGAADGWNTSNWNPGTFDPYQESMPDLGLDIPVVLAWNDAGILARSFTFLEQAVGWTKIGTSVWDGSIDYFSPYFSDPLNPLRAYVIYSSNGTLAAGRFTNLFDTVVSFDKGNTIGTPDDSFTNRARIIASREESGFVLAVWHDDSGVMYSRSVDFANTWTAPARLGNDLAGQANPNLPVGAAVYDEFQMIYAPTGVIDSDGAYIYQPYYATSKVGAFAIATNIPASYRAVPGDVFDLSATSGIVSMEKLGSVLPTDPLGVVTFDPGGFPYSLIAAAGTTALPGRGDVAYNNTNLAGIGLSCGVLVSADYEADYIIDSLSFVRIFTFGGTLTNLRIQTYVNIYDANNDLLVTKSIEDATYTSSAAIGAGDTQTVTINAEKLGLTEPARKVEFGAVMSWTSDSGAGVAFTYVDDLTMSGTLVTFDAIRKIYKTDPAAGVWNEITPAQKNVPTFPYALASIYVAPPSISDTLAMIATDPDGYNYLYRTTSGGAAWSRVGRSKWLGVKRGGATLILFGFNRLDVSPDIGDTIYKRLGNWAAQVGTIGEIRGVMGVL